MSNAARAVAVLALMATLVATSHSASATQAAGDEPIRGDATYYEGDGLTGACGKVLGKAATGTKWYAARPNGKCGARLRVWHEGRHVDVRVWDRCGCDTVVIDLCPHCFKVLAPLSEGRIKVKVVRRKPPQASALSSPSSTLEGRVRDPRR